ncbi:hypothetical protein GCM10007170_00660 [Arthrobacter liuii]|uniref:Uncharacterized protein n=1 Tax=Arthrobacter liuii TaxID=1476996 RepID=A0ABQ2AF85_9MICC|nr:hypothetical protein GCM10007170_00660 [Arthrobacter liuii]
MDPAAVRGGWFLLLAVSSGLPDCDVRGRPGGELLTWALTAHPKELLWHLTPL